MSEEFHYSTPGEDDKGFHSRFDTPAKCWEILKRASTMLTVPGFTQAQLHEDKVFGTEFRKNCIELQHLLVDTYSIHENELGDDESIKRVGALIQENQQLQLKYILSELANAGAAMQYLPSKEIIIEVVKASDDSINTLKNLTDEQRAQLKSLETGDKHLGVCKMHPLVMDIVSAGITAAGGHAEFGKLQMDANNALPDSVRENPMAVMASQLIGAVTQALANRARDPAMMSVQIRTIIELSIMTRMAMGMSYVALWHKKPDEMVDHITGVLKQAISNTTAQMAEKAEEDANQVANDAILKAMNMSKADVSPAHKPLDHTPFKFPGNGTLN
jgi:hypothetical protein